MRASSSGGELRRRWSFAVAAIIAGVSLSAVIGIALVLGVGGADDRVVARYLQNVVTAERLRSAADRESAGARAFLLSRDPVSLERSRQGRVGFATHIVALRQQSLSLEEEMLVDQVEATDNLYRASLDHCLALAHASSTDDPVRGDLEANVVPIKRELDDLLVRLASRAASEASVAQQSALDARSGAVRVLALAGVLAVGLAAVLGILLRRALMGLASERLQLAASLALVEQSNRDLDAFAGRVAHDLRNALGPAVLSLELLRSSTPTAERLKGVADRLDRANKRAMALIDALLAFSRASDHTDDGTSFVGDVLADVMDQLATAIAQGDVTVEQSVANLEVCCPRGLLQLVLVNVVGNAVKFVQGRPTRVVSVTARAENGGCLFRVVDTGPGIPVALRERVFEPFFRAPGVKSPGTGIGLATVRRIIEAHGGRAVVAPWNAGGTAIHVWVPQHNAFPDVTTRQAAPPR